MNRLMNLLLVQLHLHYHAQAREPASKLDNVACVGY